MKTVSAFRGADVEGIAMVLADTTCGLTGSEISHILAECHVTDVNPSMTKWKRLYNALIDEQNRSQRGNHIVGFIHKAMNPVRWVGKKQAFQNRRAALNQVLAFSGLTLGDDGKLCRSARASTLDEAETRADSLRAALVQRNVHADVLLFCRAELLQQNYFHAVLEATKSIASKIRALSGLSSDGAALASEAFGLGAKGAPVLAINPLQTETHRGEQKGFVNLLVGLFGMFRNPGAHAEKIFWPLGEQDALDILSLVSLVHRKLDVARRA